MMKDNKQSFKSLRNISNYEENENITSYKKKDMIMTLSTNSQSNLVCFSSKISFSIMKTDVMEIKKRKGRRKIPNFKTSLIYDCYNSLIENNEYKTYFLNSNLKTNVTMNNNQESLKETYEITDINQTIPILNLNSIYSNCKHHTDIDFRTLNRLNYINDDAFLSSFIKNNDHLINSITKITPNPCQKSQISKVPGKKKERLLNRKRKSQNEKEKPVKKSINENNIYISKSTFHQINLILKNVYKLILSKRIKKRIGKYVLFNKRENLKFDHFFNSQFESDFKNYELIDRVSKVNDQVEGNVMIENKVSLEKEVRCDNNKRCFDVLNYSDRLKNIVFEIVNLGNSLDDFSKGILELKEINDLIKKIPVLVIDDYNIIENSIEK